MDILFCESENFQYVQSLTGDSPQLNIVPHSMSHKIYEMTNKWDIGRYGGDFSGIFLRSQVTCYDEI